MSKGGFVLLLFVYGSIYAQDFGPIGSGFTLVKEFYDKDDGIVFDESQSYYYQVGKKGQFTRTTETSSFTFESYDDTVYTYYTRTKELRSKQLYVDGYKFGIYTEYYEDGILKTKGAYKKNRKVNHFTSWYPNGKTQQILEYFFDPNVVSEYSFIDYKIIDYWDSLGNQVVRAGNGVCRCYIETEGYKPVLEVGKVVNGFRDSLWTGSADGLVVFKEMYEHEKFLTGTRLEDNVIYNEIEKQAEYVNGYGAMADFLQKHLKYPASARRHKEQGTVFVGFIVGRDGFLSDLYIVKGVSETLDEEAIRVVESMPPWVPGKIRGRYVKSKFVLPLKFKLAM